VHQRMSIFVVSRLVASRQDRATFDEKRLVAVRQDTEVLRTDHRHRPSAAPGSGECCISRVIHHFAARLPDPRGRP
jgi:hypothetical protein